MENGQEMVIYFQELKVLNPTTHFVLYQDPSHILNTPHGKIFSTNPEFCVMREHIDLALLKVIHMFSCLQQIPTSFDLCQQIYLHKRPDSQCGPSSSIWGNLVC